MDLLKRITSNRTKKKVCIKKHNSALAKCGQIFIPASELPSDIKQQKINDIELNSFTPTLQSILAPFD